MGKRDDRDERKARAVGDQYASGAAWMMQNQKGGGKLAFSPPDGMPVVKLEANKIYRFSFLPTRVGKRHPNPAAKPGELFWNRVYANHPRLGPDKTCVLCLAQNFKERCPCCDENERMFRVPMGQMTPADKELMKAMKSKVRIMALVFDHDNPAKGIQFFEDSYASFGQTYHVDRGFSSGTSGFPRLARIMCSVLLRR